MSLAVAIIAVAAAALVALGLVGVTAVLCSRLRVVPSREIAAAPARPAVATTPAPDPRRDPSPAEPACPVQLMFVCDVGDSLLVDGVLLGPAWSDHGLVPAGSPVTLRVHVPRDQVIAAGTANVLRRWADDASVVRARFREDGDAVRAQLVHGDVRLLVDLDDVLLAPRI